jgi:hypothetical protein
MPRTHGPRSSGRDPRDGLERLLQSPWWKASRALSRMRRALGGWSGSEAREKTMVTEATPVRGVRAATEFSIVISGRGVPESGEEGRLR